MPTRSIAHRLLASLFRILATPLRRADLLIADATRFGIDPLHDIARLAAAWHTPITCVFDVGANDGSTALELHARFPAATILSIEPHPDTYARLTAATAHVPCIHTRNTAVGAAPGTLPLTTYTESRVNTLKPSFHAEGRFQTTATLDVPVTTLDQICSQLALPSIGLLKIDTEGFDLHVLQGAASLLQRAAIRFVYVECNDLQVNPADPGTGLLSIDQYLRPHGFRFIAAYNDYNNLKVASSVLKRPLRPPTAGPLSTDTSTK